MAARSLEELMAAVQAELGAVITKPKLVEKYLSKPPFRYLHDIVTSVTQATGFGSGLFSDAELDAASLQDKTAKMEYLDKIIGLVAQTTGEPLAVRSGKIVAGAEPENTNEFLLALARAATQKQAPAPAPPQASRDDGAAAVAAAEAEKRARDAAERERAERERAERERAERERAAATAAAAAAAERERLDAAAARPSRGGSGFTPAASLGVTSDMARTIDMLQPYVPKPKLTEKLLSKPPFRFLFDVFSAVAASCGVGVGLHGDLSADDAGKDKGSKTAYLDRVINMLGLQLGTHLRVKSAAIVAGLEADATNEMLQALALVCAEAGSRPTTDAVRRVLAGQVQPGPNGEGAQSSAAPTPAPVPAPARTPAPAPVAAPAARERSAEPRPAPVAAPYVAPAPEPAPYSVPPPMDAPPFSDTAQGMDALGAARSSSSRPKTAQRRPPRIRDTVTPVASVASQIAPAATGLITEGADDSDEEERAAATRGSALSGADSELGDGRNVLDAARAAGGQGKHTRDILTDANAAAANGGGKMAEAGDEEGGGGIRMGRVKRAGATTGSGKASLSAGGYSSSELASLQEAIQKLCTSTNPLGKSMDYLAEDVEDMRSELRTWRADYKKRRELLDRELKSTDAELEPLRTQLASTEAACEDMRRRIATMKTSVSKNDVRIQELVRMVVMK